MRRSAKAARWLIAIAFTLALLALWPLLSYARGFLAAKTDIARGQYKVLTYGLPMPWRQTDADMLKQRFNIKEEAVAGCIVSQSLMKYVQGYDEASMAGANRKFGRDVFRETAETAKVDWENKHPQKTN